MNKKFSRRAAGFAIAGAFAWRASDVRAQSGDPVALIRAMFADYAADRIPKPPYSPAIANRLKTKEMDADVILDAQDIEVKNVKVSEVERVGEKAVIDARFESFQRQMHVRFDFRVVDGRWMIANVRRLAGSDDPFDMRKWLRLPPLT